MKEERIVPQIQRFSFTFSHCEPLCDAEEEVIVLIAEEKTEIVLSRRVYSLTKGDAFFALPHSYLRQKSKDPFAGYQIHLPLDAFRTFAPQLYLDCYDKGMALSFSVSTALRLLSLCETFTDQPSIYAIPALFSILERDAIASESSALEIPLPKFLRRALAMIEESAPLSLSSEEIATRCEVSQTTLQRAFRQFLATTPHQYVQAICRLHEQKNGVK